jgi:hypothetical protein
MLVSAAGCILEWAVMLGRFPEWYCPELSGASDSLGVIQGPCTGQT